MCFPSFRQRAALLAALALQHFDRALPFYKTLDHTVLPLVNRFLSAQILLFFPCHVRAFHGFFLRLDCMASDAERLQIAVSVGSTQMKRYRVVYLERGRELIGGGGGGGGGAVVKSQTLSLDPTHSANPAPTSVPARVLSFDDRATPTCFRHLAHRATNEN